MGYLDRWMGRENRNKCLVAKL